MIEIFLDRQYPITEVLLSFFISNLIWNNLFFNQYEWMLIWNYSWSSKCIVLDKKSIPIVAWYVLSNESYMNLDIILNVSHYESIKSGSTLWWVKFFQHDFLQGKPIWTL